MATQTAIACPECSESLEGSRPFINLCRATFAAALVRDYPGETAWGLSIKTGEPYSTISKGLQKGREDDLFILESEEREKGGIRYRYWLADGAEERLREWHKRTPY